jgi:hypothetical protein
VLERKGRRSVACFVGLAGGAEGKDSRRGSFGVELAIARAVPIEQTQRFVTVATLERSLNP